MSQKDIIDLYKSKQKELNDKKIELTSLQIAKFLGLRQQTVLKNLECLKNSNEIISREDRECKRNAGRKPVYYSLNEIE